MREKLCEHRGFTCSQRGAAVVVPSGRLAAELQSLTALLQRGCAAGFLWQVSRILSALVLLRVLDLL